MQKLLALLAALTLLPICALGADNDAFNGFYVGAQMGVIYGIFEHSGYAELDVPATHLLAAASYPVPTNDHASNLGGDGGLHIGYGHTFNRFYLGAEINADLQSANVKSHSIPSNGGADLYATTGFTASLNNTYGIVLRPGLLLNPTLMLYLKGGLAGTQVEGSNIVAFSVPVKNYQINSTIKGSDTVLGWQTGIGIEKRVGKHWAFRAEDIVSGYGTLTVSQTEIVNQAGIPANSILSNTMHLSTYSNAILVGASFYFG